MLHTKRQWLVTDVDHSPEELAKKLEDGGNWTLCTGLRCGAVLWLCDSISPDSVQEYAVVREADLQQIETVTVSWCTPEQLQRFAESLGTDPCTSIDMGTIRAEAVSPKHEPCPHCR